MAKFPKASGLAKGENPNGFRSVGGAGYANRDPTQAEKKPDPNNPAGNTNVNGDRWGQWDRGGVDSQGGEHDW